MCGHKLIIPYTRERGKTKWLVAHPKQRAKRAGCHCGRGLGAQPPVGSRGEAPGGGLGGRSPPGSRGLGRSPQQGPGAEPLVGV